MIEKLNMGPIKDIQAIVTEIVRLTSHIETMYPELYRFLDENPMTIPSEANPHLDKATLASYLGDLKELLRHHQLTHKNVER